ncbi:hypothetical protein [Novosphingobium cyanobacteriorum]|uniref:Uncharacterized protein n=1 Tax=Novosphingobium cyanobacteriorum TaxID=3024215 RepID=A0ABT6CPK6_9SPHN|nr:hypothetical protein [Novosphingobium cyanobacteriorum]MDF8335864.1 hypothetical protein [Novosphingobium cyanobacteriorum]
MATNPIGGDPATVTRFPVPAQMPTVVQILSRFDRPTVEAFLSVAIDLLDAMDPDPDVELNGDEFDHNNGEDEEYGGGSNRPLPWGGPGCPISDPDSAIDDRECDDVDQDLEPEEVVVPAYGLDQTTGALPIDPAADRQTMLPHIERIRAKQCVLVSAHPYFGGAPEPTFRLKCGG